MDLGVFVRERRKAMGLTQQQLADVAGVGLNFVYQLEKNKPSVQLDCMRQVLDALGYELAVTPRPGAGASLFPVVRASDGPDLPWD